MSYKINKTDGVLLVDLVDGKIDTATTDLTLIGRNFSGYGELFNENFIKILENFAAVSPPSNPLEGQLWYDKGDGRLKVWNGEQFRLTDTTVVGTIEPALLAGDIWIDSKRQQLYFNDGTNTTLAGPIYTRDQGPTGFKVETINDRFGNPKTVAKLIVNSTELALISRESFEAALNQPGFGKNIQEGININSNRPEFEFRGTSTRARQLIDSTGDLVVPENFLKINSNNVTTGTLHVNNDLGLRIGSNVSFVTRMQLNPKIVIQEILDSNANYKITVNRNNIPDDAFFINTASQRIGIWNNTPSATLDVNGDVRISGSLTILGDTTTVETTNLKVEDKNIELNFSSDSTPAGDAVASGGGITLLSSNGNKTFQWEQSSNSWTSNVNLNLLDGFSYSIGGQAVLSKTELASTVTQANGLTQIGSLIGLTAANFNFASSTMTVTDALTIVSADDIIIADNKKITGLGNPVDPQDAATKNYVDSTTKSEPIRLALDITGLTNSQIGDVLLNLYPIGSKQVNTKAFIATSSYSGTVVTNPTSQTTKSFVAVDSGGVQNQSVVQDFSFTNTTNSVTLTVNRGYKTYIWNGVIWQFLAEFVDP
jgi:hypothetical protein